MNPFLDIIFNGKWTPSTENTQHTLREFASLGNGCPAGVTLGLQVKVRFYSQDVNPDNSNRTWVSHSQPPDSVSSPVEWVSIALHTHRLWWVLIRLYKSIL